MPRYKQNRLTAGAPRLFGLITLALFFAAWLMISSVQATTLYVSDTTLEANLRTGTKTDNRIIGLLRPGTRLNVLREQEGWAEVTLDDGRTGWILKRYISDRPPWRVTAERLSTQNEQLQSQLRQITSQQSELLNKNNELKKRMQTQQAALQAVSSEYTDLKDSSANYLNLKSEYENLQSQARQNKAKLEALREAHKDLKLSRGIRWFLSCAGVLLLGGLLGASMARMRRRRSGDYYRL